MTIGILGGGQLGYMLALAGYPLGLHFRFLDPSPEAPVGRIAQRVLPKPPSAASPSASPPITPTRPPSKNSPAASSW